MNLQNNRDIYDLSAHGTIIENNSSGYDIGNRYFITYCPYGDGVTFGAMKDHLKLTKEGIMSILTDYEMKKITQDLQELIIDEKDKKFQININYGKFYQDMEFDFILQTYIGSMTKIVKSGIVKHKQDAPILQISEGKQNPILNEERKGGQPSIELTPYNYYYEILDKIIYNFNDLYNLFWYYYVELWLDITVTEEIDYRSNLPVCTPLENYKLAKFLFYKAQNYLEKEGSIISRDIFKANLSELLKYDILEPNIILLITTCRELQDGLRQDLDSNRIISEENQQSEDSCNAIAVNDITVDTQDKICKSRGYLGCGNNNICTKCDDTYNINDFVIFLELPIFPNICYTLTELHDEYKKICIKNNGYSSNVSSSNSMWRYWCGGTDIDELYVLYSILNEPELFYNRYIEFDFFPYAFPYSVIIIASAFNWELHSLNFNDNVIPICIELYNQNNDYFINKVKDVWTSRIADFKDSRSISTAYNKLESFASMLVNDDDNEKKRIMKKLEPDKDTKDEILDYLRGIKEPIGIEDPIGIKDPRGIEEPIGIKGPIKRTTKKTENRNKPYQMKKV